jgi:hypothetical protein
MLYRKPQDDPSGAAIDDLHVRRGEQKFLPASFSRYHGHFTAPRRLPNWTLAMPSAQKLDAHHKALTLNLDTSTFGSPKSAPDRKSRVVPSRGRNLWHGG